jgi:hypothetical protein
LLSGSACCCCCCSCSGCKIGNATAASATVSTDAAPARLQLQLVCQRTQDVLHCRPWHGCPSAAAAATEHQHHKCSLHAQQQLALPD